MLDGQLDRQARRAALWAVGPGEGLISSTDQDHGAAGRSLIGSQPTDAGLGIIGEWQVDDLSAATADTQLDSCSSCSCSCGCGCSCGA